jgi:hypothetical protein
MGHESRIEPWLPMTTVLLVSFRTDWLRREDTMKTAWKETGNRWAAVFSIRMDGAAGQNRTCSSTWGWKQEKFQRWGKCFFLTSPSIEHPPRRKRRGFLRPLGSFSRDGFGGFLPQPPYFSGGPRRGITFGLPAHRSFRREHFMLPHSKKQEGLISPASKAEALRPSRVRRAQSTGRSAGAGDLSTCRPCRLRRERRQRPSSLLP